MHNNNDTDDVREVGREGAADRPLPIYVCVYK